MLSFKPVNASSSLETYTQALNLIGQGFGFKSQVNFQCNDFMLICAPHALAPRMFLGCLPEASPPDAMGPPNACPVATGVLHLAGLWSISAVTVHPAYRGQGYGTAMIRFLADELERLFLLPSNAGFVTLMARAGLYGPAINAGFEPYKTDAHGHTLMIRSVPYQPA